MVAMTKFLRAAKAAGCPRDQIENFARAGYVPQPKQLLFHAACRECDEPGGPTEVGFGGARGPGKSHATLAQLALDDCQRVSGLKCLLLRRVGKAVRESFQDLRVSVLKYVPHKYVQQDAVLTFPNGSKVVLGHFNTERDIDAYLGLQYDVIAVEEATTLSFSKYEAVGTCCRTSKLGWRPREYSNANPGGLGHAWYKERFIVPAQLGKQNGTRFFGATIDDNAFINPEYTNTLDALTGWRKRAWRYGDWDIMAGQYFTTFRRDVHSIDPLPIEPWWDLWLAMDYGFAHWNVTYLFGKWQGVLYVIDECARRRTLPADNAAGVREMLARNGVDESRLVQFVAGRDVFASRGETGRSIADAWSDEGFELEPANMARVQGAAEIQRRLGTKPPTLFIFKHCVKLLDCLPILEHNPRKPEDVLKVDTDDRGRGGDDPYDTLRYGVMAEEDSQPTKYGYSGPGVYSGSGVRRR